MKLLPTWVLPQSLPAFNDAESRTAVEQTYKVYQAMNNLIGEYNKFAEEVNKEVEAFETKYNGDIEIFTTSIRQQFQDFIGIVDLKIQNFQKFINESDFTETLEYIEEFKEELATFKEDVNSELEKRINNIENVLEGKAFNYETEENVEVSNVPVDALPYAMVTKVKGSTKVLNESLVHANITSVIITGRNLWNEEWEIGAIDTKTGQSVTNGSRIRSKNYIKVNPNTKYYTNIGTSDALVILQYDNNKNFISSKIFSLDKNSEFTTNNDTHFIKFFLADSVYKDVYNNDICINIYDESFNGTYESYKEEEVIKVNEELKAFDYEDYSINKKVIATEIVDLGSLDWSKTGAGYFRAVINNKKIRSNFDNSRSYLYCTRYNCGGVVYDNYFVEKTFYETPNDNIIYIFDNSYSDATTFKNSLSGVMLAYELATPTEIEIDDKDSFIKVEKGGIVKINEGTFDIAYQVEVK